MKSILISFVFFYSLITNASISAPDFLLLASATSPFLTVNQDIWEAGQELSYELKVGDQIGEMKEVLTEDESHNFLLTQTMTLGEFQRAIIYRIDRNQEVIQTTINGESVALPNLSPYKVIKAGKTKTKVTAGEFQCIRFIMEDVNGDGVDACIASGKMIPINSHLKVVTIKNKIKISIELKSFKFKR